MPKTLILGAALLVLASCSTEPTAGVAGLPQAPRDVDLRIVFGSCADDEKPDHPVWEAMLAAKPDLSILLGDNVYADSRRFSAAPSIELLRAEYAKLAASSGFAALHAAAPMLATWDDHDYGLNDGGKEFEFKAQAQKVFVEFWQLPADDPRRSRAGVYHSEWLQAGERSVQVVLLDTRYFRDAQPKKRVSLSCPVANYTKNATGSVLGEAQWQWLEAQLGKPADLRLIVSSIQVIPQEHCFEKWANFPTDRQRLLKTLANANGGQSVVLSGDRHLGEISALTLPRGEDSLQLVEVTTSPLSARSGFGEGEPNQYRISEDNLRESQFGVLELVQDQVRLELRDAHGVTRFHHAFTLPFLRSELGTDLPPSTEVSSN